MKILTDISQIDKQQWSDFVKNHPLGTVFQTPEMYECYANAESQPNIIVAEENGQIVGVLASVLLKEKGIKGCMSVRSIVTGGPIAKNNDKYIIEQLLLAYDTYAHKVAIYSQFRNQFSLLEYCDIFRNAGYVFEPHLNFIIPTDTEETLWNRIGKGRKKQIKKAQQNNLKVEAYEDDILTEELIEKGYMVIRDVYHRANLPLADIQLIKQAAMQQLLVMFVVRNTEDEILGCRFGLKYKTNLYGWYAGSCTKYYKLFPNDILIWETLRWCSEHGYDTFDYGGAGSPNKPYGVRDFKAQMGGELVNFGRYEKHHKPCLMWIATLGYKIYRVLFKFK